MFIQCLISTIDEAALKKFRDYSKFSRVAWPEYKNQAGAWRSIRNPRKNGQVKTINIKDLISISRALELPLSELFFRVEQRLKMGWQPPEVGSSTTRLRAAKETAKDNSDQPSEKGGGGIQPSEKTSKLA